MSDYKQKSAHFLRRNKDWIIGVLCVYLLAMAYMAVFQRNYLYFPGDVRPDIELFEALDRPQIIEVTPEDGLDITGWYWPPSESDKPVIVYFHGNAQDYSYWLERAKYFRNDGYGFLLAEYRGYGGNDGFPTEQGLYNDARAYLNYLINNLNINPQDIVLIGRSLGSGVATQMATEYTVRALVLESAYSSAVDVASASYWYFPVSYLMWDRFNSLEKIGSVQSPVLIIHGEKDDLIPISQAEKLYMAVKQNKKMVRIEGAGHNDIYAGDAQKYIIGFLEGLDYPDKVENILPE